MGDMGVWVDGCMEGWRCGRMDRGTGGWMGGLTDEWTDGWKDGLTYL